jgi:hypothetical protein
MAVVFSFLLTWLITFVVCFAVVEFAQNYFYDEVTPHAGWKVLGGSALLALVLTWAKAGFDTMFTSQFPATIVLGIVAFGVFVLIYRFHPWHGAPIGIITALVLAGISTLVVDSFQNRGATLAPIAPPSKPIRVSAGTPVVAPAAKSAAGPAGGASNPVEAP